MRKNALVRKTPSPNKIWFPQDCAGDASERWRINSSIFPIRSDFLIIAVASPNWLHGAFVCVCANVAKCYYLKWQLCLLLM